MCLSTVAQHPGLHDKRSTSTEYFEPFQTSQFSGSVRCQVWLSVFAVFEGRRLPQNKIKYETLLNHHEVETLSFRLYRKQIQLVRNGSQSKCFY